jgi:hypothetical protein
MEKAGCEALFVGTGGVVSVYTDLAIVNTSGLGKVQPLMQTFLECCCIKCADTAFDA